jgi:hypothetical protein
VKWSKLSCRRFKDNATRLQLFALAYNLAYFLRQLVLLKVVAHAKYVTFQLAKVAVPRS